ncbi:MAG: hypothetical protein ABSF90_26625 [Syntrophobacteraceae bacterium]|jgi:hypothetical protein
MEQTTSCQIQGLDKNLWLKFRQMCLTEGISASGKVRAMIEAAVAATDTASLEKGKSNER